MSSPSVNGPNGDGSKSLAKESKWGLAVTFLLTAAGTVALEALTNLDTSGWQGWWVPLGVVAVSTAAGLLTAWLKKNR
jgi:hypothetical protein